jgi:FkbM family methyltransferase
VPTSRTHSGASPPLRYLDERSGPTISSPLYRQFVMSDSIRNVLLNKTIPFMFSRSSAQRVNRALFRIAAIGMGVSSFDSTQSDERRFLRTFLLGKVEPVVLDVGANCGQYARLLRAESPGANIYSFEPHPVTFAKLEAVAKTLRITPVNAGVGSIEGVAQLHDYETDAGSEHASLIPGIIERIHHSRSKAISVDLITIDSFVAKQRLSKIALLKIDVEGFELEVLKGARNLILNKHVDAIQLEFNEMSVVARTFVCDVAAALPGYQLHRLLKSGEIVSLSDANILRRELFGYQNLIALRHPD